MIFVLPVLMMMIGCEDIDSNMDNTDSEIKIHVGRLDETKATLVTDDNLAETFPTMEVLAVSGRDTKCFTTSFDTEEAINSEYVTTGYRWNSDYDSYTFYSYPKGSFSTRFNYGTLKFDYQVAKNSTDTPDLVIAATKVSYGEVASLYYKHVFTAVNVVYKDLKAGHTISSIKIKDSYTFGTCEVSTESVKWQSSKYKNKADLVDETVRSAYVNNTELTKDGCKFMTIPGQDITLEIVIDGKTFTKTCGAKEAGDYVTFYIHDNFTIDQEEGEEGGGAGTESKIEKNPDGTYKLTLGSWVTGEQTSTMITKGAPADYILVLDNSGSMTWNLKGTNGGTSRLSLLKSAVNGFLDQVSKHASDNDITHRVSIVSFGKTDYPGKNKNYPTLLTETPITSTATGVNTQVIKQWTSDMSVAKTAIASLDAKGGNTASGMGMELAYQLAKTARDNVPIVIIFFTDGSPEYQGGKDSWTTTYSLTINNETFYNYSTAYCANETVYNAYKCKNELGAEVFSILICSSSKDRQNVLSYSETVSSNYPDATSVFKSATSTTLYGRGSKRTDGKEYFYDASSSESGLSNAFTTIQTLVETSHAAIDIHEEAMVKVFITEVFTMPANITGNLKFYKVYQKSFDATTKKITWYDKSDWVDITSSITYSIDSNNLTISGFDYGNNFCGKGRNDFGCKLVVEFDCLQAGDDAEGAYGIGYNSGLYEPGDDGDDTIALFPPPVIP